MNTRAFFIVCATSLSAFSAEQPSNWYAGGMVTHNGKTETEAPDASFGSAVKFGYQVSPTWAIEASTGFYGKLDMVESGEKRNTKTKESRYATDLSLLGNVPLSKRYQIYGGLGALWESNDLSPIAQLGIRYSLSKQWSFNFGYKFLLNQDDEYKLQSLGFGAQYRFDKENVHVEPPIYEKVNVISNTQQTSDSISEVTTERTQNPQCDTNVYRVQSGDWLYKIAEKHNISYAELKSLNNQFEDLRSNDVIYPDQIINVPNSQCQ
ncbi:LysM domain-containing protein [Vibrio owensii]|uniref:LysM peptidoglycan-binding domain-containing protein n=1 Tax=Vibrio owensii TaxID=696485 RepID=UPI0028954268|nr:LysM domain-containing protein [Vibrio owensii]CAH1550837.1 LysM domain-containing protein [Vibrio owensii]